MRVFVFFTLARLTNHTLRCALERVGPEARMFAANAGIDVDRLLTHQARDREPVEAL